MQTVLDRQRMFNTTRPFLSWVTWIVGDNNIANIRYHFKSPEYVRTILDTYPYQETNPDEEPGPDKFSLAATHPIVNNLLNTPVINKTPYVLYLEPEYNEGKDLQRFEFDNVRTSFDVLGAVNTYYMDKAKNNRGQVDKILHGHIYFGGLRIYNDGYEVILNE